jgi:hypothetical protein
VESQIALLRSEYEAEEAEAFKVIGFEKARNERFVQDKATMAKSRKADAQGKTAGANNKNINE